MLRSLQDLENYEIGATDGSIGHVKDFYFDDHAWVIRYLVVETGSWFSSRQVLISPISIHDPDWAKKLLPVSITKEQVKNSPEIDTQKPVSRQHEMQYLGYYGYPYYWGGDGLWGSGMYPYSMSPGYAVPANNRVERETVRSEIATMERALHDGEDPNLRSCDAVLGYHIHAIDGDIGHVSGLLVDEETWAIRYIVIDTSNWWVGHQVLIAPQWITDVSWADQSVTVDLTRESVKTAPDFDSTLELNRERETGLYHHHKRHGYWMDTLVLEREI
jgi:hypothetical protein